MNTKTNDNQLNHNQSPHSFPVRLPAECENHDCVLLAWPHEETDWAYMLDEARECFANIVRAISARECVLLVGPKRLCNRSVKQYSFDPARVRFIDVETNDTWARDFGPITVEKEGALHILDFKFNAWGLKFPADKDNLITTHLALKGTFNADYENRLGFVLEGGSIESDGHGTLLTTAECLLSPNRNGGMNEEQIRAYLADALGFTHQLWLRNGGMAGDDTDSHIDTLARFAVNDTIVYVGCDDPADEHFEELAAMEREIKEFTTVDGRKFNLVRLPMPDAIYDENGERLPATYANFLATPDTIYMPAYGQTRKDELAARILNVAFEREVVAIDCRALIRQHGSLHCATMQMPLQILNT